MFGIISYLKNPNIWLCLIPVGHIIYKIYQGIFGYRRQLQALKRELEEFKQMQKQQEIEREKILKLRRARRRFRIHRFCNAAAEFAVRSQAEKKKLEKQRFDLLLAVQRYRTHVFSVRALIAINGRIEQKYLRLQRAWRRLHIHIMVVKAMKQLVDPRLKRLRKQSPQDIRREEYILYVLSRPATQSSKCERDTALEYMGGRTWKRRLVKACRSHLAARRVAAFPLRKEVEPFQPKGLPIAAKASKEKANKKQKQQKIPNLTKMSEEHRLAGYRPYWHDRAYFPASKVMENYKKYTTTLEALDFVIPRDALNNATFGKNNPFLSQFNLPGGGYIISLQRKNARRIFSPVTQEQAEDPLFETFGLLTSVSGYRGPCKNFKAIFEHLPNKQLFGLSLLDTCCKGDLCPRLVPTAVETCHKYRALVCKYIEGKAAPPPVIKAPIIPIDVEEYPKAPPMATEGLLIDFMTPEEELEDIRNSFRSFTYPKLTGLDTPESDGMSDLFSDDE